MEVAMNNGFCELSQSQLRNIDGGFIVAVVAIGSATYTITSGMVAGAVGSAWALGHVVNEVYKAFK